MGRMISIIGADTNGKQKRWEAGERYEVAITRRRVSVFGYAANV